MVSATSLTVTSPAGTGTVHVTVVTPNGTSATSTSDQFTYNPRTDGHRAQPEQRGPGRRQHRHGQLAPASPGPRAVHFGTTAGTSVTVISATSLTVTAPSGTGTVDVTVTTPNGTSVANANDLYTYNGPPTVTGVSPNNGPAAGGTLVTVSGTGFTGATGRRLRLHRGHRAHRGQRHQPHSHRSVGNRHGRRHGHHPQRHLGDQRQ